jgi:pimeloyl-ACP methyl ester carboxylesterase
VIRRGFVGHQGGFVHWRAMGEGPVVVLLHESPRSSASLLPLMRSLGQNYCCIAFDTPGYGASDPLSDRFSPISAFSEALLSAITSLGVDDFHLYGTHTGAALAIELALRVPERVTSLLLDGLAIFSHDEQRDLLSKYLLPQAAEWDGSHLMRIWSRIRDQGLFFPFYNRSRSSRLDPPKQDLQFMLRTCIGFLEAGDYYRDGYQAAITFDARQKIGDLSLPVRLHALENDLLAGHLSRAKGANTALEIESRPLSKQLWLSRSQGWFSQGNSSVKSAACLPQDTERYFMDSGEYPVFLSAGSGKGVLIRAVSPGIRSAGMYGPIADSSSAKWFVDPPGFGTNANAQFDIDDLGEALSCNIAFERCDAPAFVCGAIGFDGGFLIKSWFAVRDSLFFEPWCDYENPISANDVVDLRGLSSGHLTLLKTALAHQLD